MNILKCPDSVSVFAKDKLLQEISKDAENEIRGIFIII